VGRAGLEDEFTGREQRGSLRRPGRDRVDVQVAGQDQDGRGDGGQPCRVCSGSKAASA
jgi:hypothetical protein